MTNHPFRIVPPAKLDAIFDAMSNGAYVQEACAAHGYQLADLGFTANLDPSIIDRFTAAQTARLLAVVEAVYALAAQALDLIEQPIKRCAVYPILSSTCYTGRSRELGNEGVDCRGAVLVAALFFLRRDRIT